MKKIINALLSISAIIFTVYFMSLNDLTTNEGALSKTGIEHPFLFFIWGLLAYISLYTNIFMLAGCLQKVTRFHFVAASAALIGIIFTVVFKFDYSLKFQYFMHCAGSLTFSVCTAIAVFITYLSGFKISKFNAVLTVAVGTISTADLILLIIYKQTALIEGLPVIFALAAMPVSIYVNDSKQRKKVHTNAA